MLIASPGGSSRFRILAQVLVILAPTLISARKRSFQIEPRILPLEFFEGTRHLRRDLIELLAAGSGMKGGLESQTIEFVIHVEVFATRRIILMFGTTQPD